ncbi:MAG: TonB family protein [Bacteroidetes bacterium]|nr:TonB family protein [Bacteroidota bacterium]
MSKKLFTMKPENILKTDWLDILFENKNKNYGAYNLRKFYNDRLKKSLGITALLVLVFAGLQSWKTPKKTVTFEFGETTLVDLKNYKTESPKPKEAEKPKPKHEMNEVKVTTPVIVPKEFADPIPTVEAIDTSAIGFKNNFSGGRDSGLVGVDPGKPDDKGLPKGNIDVIKSTDDTEIVLNPSVMPEFNGGIDALKNFMLRNLRQPDDIEQGEKVVVIVKFVVDKYGNIKDSDIVQSGREDLDAEVLRVINKMPSWKPGLQNGYPVAAYFKMPVSFINNN